MKHRIPDGVWPTMLTPFASDGRIDEAAVRRLTEWYMAQGVAGIFAVCQSSEMFDLSLPERVRLARIVAESAARKVPVVASGHISDDLPGQIAELRAVAATGVDAVVLVSNRLAAENESDDILIRHASAILEALPDTDFGIYECPYPYKRLLSEKVIRWCLQNGRITFIKDTCCDAQRIARRVKQIEGSRVKLFNANAPTLLRTLRDGVNGYCGILANFCPRLLAWLFRNYLREPQKAERVQAFLTMFSWVETQEYPACAKYYLDAAGVRMETGCRANGGAPLSGYARDEIDAIRRLDGFTEALLTGPDGKPACG